MRKLLLLVMLLALAGCIHDVKFRAPEVYAHEKVLPLRLAFCMEGSLKEKVFTKRSFMSGYGNKWVVPIGNIAHIYGIAYLKGGFGHFGEFEIPEDAPGYDLYVTVNDVVLKMPWQSVHYDLTVTITDKAGRSEVKTYHADGPSGLGRVIAARAFAQKSAIRQSTHVAMANIYKEIFRDLSMRQSGATD